MPRLLELLGVDEETVRWTDLAACNGMDTELFYDDYEKDPKLAQQVDEICKTCPVIQACYRSGVKFKDEGVHGGIYLSNGKPDRIRNKHKTAEDWNLLQDLLDIEV